MPPGLCGCIIVTIVYKYDNWILVLVITIFLGKLETVQQVLEETTLALG